MYVSSFLFSCAFFMYGEDVLKKLQVAILDFSYSPQVAQKWMPRSIEMKAPRQNSLVVLEENWLSSIELWILEADKEMRMKGEGWKKIASLKT